MSNTILSLTLCALLLAFGLSAEAQQAKKVPRIGFITVSGDPSTPSPNFEALRQGLRDLGYIEGKNIQIESRYAEGKLDRLPTLVAELVQLKVDVLVSGVYLAIRAAKQATYTIPIVMVIVVDPVATGLIDSLARPGGNITGLTRITRDLSGKRLELLKEAVPGISRVGVLWNADNSSAALAFKEYEARGPNPDLRAHFKLRPRGARAR
jgi:putative tryptophan/tyrosine transport system substrate-binding protein